MDLPRKLKITHKEPGTDVRIAPLGTFVAEPGDVMPLFQKFNFYLSTPEIRKFTESVPILTLLPWTDGSSLAHMTPYHDINDSDRIGFNIAIASASGENEYMFHLPTEGRIIKEVCTFVGAWGVYRWKRTGAAVDVASIQSFYAEAYKAGPISFALEFTPHEDNNHSSASQAPKKTGWKSLFKLPSFKESSVATFVLQPIQRGSFTGELILKDSVHWEDSAEEYTLVAMSAVAFIYGLGYRELVLKFKYRYMEPHLDMGSATPLKTDVENAERQQSAGPTEK